MYTYESGRLRAGEEEQLGAFGVIARLEGDEPRRLNYRGCESAEGSDRLGVYRSYALRYDSGEALPEAVVQLTLRCYARAVLAYVDGTVRSEGAFVSGKSYSPECGVRITVEPLSGISGLLANYQHKDWWVRPHFDPAMAKLPERTVSLLWTDGEAYRRIVPVCGPTYRADLSGGEAIGTSGLTVDVSSYQSGRNRIDNALVFAYGTSADPYRLGEELSELALEALGRPALPRSAKAYPEPLDYLGWCSWDAFYQQVDEAGLLNKAEELGRLGLPVRWFMIDDGWSDSADGRLRSFEALPEKFPQGLGHTIRELKERHRLRWVGVWHTIAGYWNGIHPDGRIASTLNRYLHETTNGAIVPSPDPGLAFGFWNAWHGELRRQGVDFVKVDSQSSIRHLLRGEKSVGEAASGAHQALDASVGLHFGGAMINCMGMASENVWHRPLSAVSRNSDDYMPKELHGFREHALQNAYNSYYHGSMYWGDWDMFWSEHRDDVRHAVLRAVSGGPVYVSDRVGGTDAAKLRPLAYEDGKLLRCDRPALPTLDCLTVDPARAGIPLKLWNTAGGAGVVAAFHLGEGDEAVNGAVSADDVPGLAGERVAVYDYFAKECRLLEPGERHAFELAPNACKLFVLCPAKGIVTPIGIADKYVASHAITRIAEDKDRTLVWLRERCVGAFVFRSELRPIQVWVEREVKPWREIGDRLYAVDCESMAHETLVEIAR